MLLLGTTFADEPSSSATQSPVNPTPQRIISCAPNLTEMLFELGVGDHVIGVTRYCEFPPQVKELPKYGDLFNPNLEAMVAAKPDLIVLYPSSGKVIDFFKDRPGVRILQTNTCETIAEIHETLRQLGDATGTRERADRIIGESEESLKMLAEIHKDQRRKKVLVVASRAKGSTADLYAAGRGTYLDEALAIAGAENVVPESAGRYPMLNRETLLSLNPEIIIEIHHDEVTAEERKEATAAWQPFAGIIDAAKNGDIRLIADKRLGLPGPRIEHHASVLEKVIWGSPL